MIKLSGLSAFPITPGSDTGRVDVSNLRALIKPLVNAGVDSIGLLGSTGSYPYLPREERRKALQTALDEAGKIPILVGVGALRTDDAVKLAQDAKAAGAAAGLLAAVSYAPLNDAEVFEHFTTVARESDLPLCIYDNPGTTHFRFSPDLVGRLSRTDGIIAVKAPAPAASEIADNLANLRSAVRDDFSVGYSGDWHSVPGLIHGADAWYSVLGGVMPDICVSIVRACQRGDMQEAARLNRALEPVFALFKEFSSLRVAYAIAHLRGATTAQPPRPILPMPDSAKSSLANALSHLTQAL